MYQKKGMEKERDGDPVKDCFQVTDIHCEPEAADTYRSFDDVLGSKTAV